MVKTPRVLSSQENNLNHYSIDGLPRSSFVISGTIGSCCVRARKRDALQNASWNGSESRSQRDRRSNERALLTAEGKIFCETKLYEP